MNIDYNDPLKPQSDGISTPSIHKEEERLHWEDKFDKECGLETPAYQKIQRTKSFIRTEIEKAKHTQLKEMLKLVEKYQEQFHGGGNGRRLFIQLLSELKELEK